MHPTFANKLASCGAAVALELAFGSVLVVLATTVAVAQPSAARSAAALSFEVELKTAPYHVAATANVGVHVPAGFDASRPLDLVIFVHGLRGCLPVLLGKGSSRCGANMTPQLGWDLGAHHDAAGTNSILIVPRLYYDKRGGQPGAFGKAGGFRAFFDELLATLSARLGRPLARQNVGTLTLIAHSAGYETALAILEHGEVDSLVRAVVLMDALYAFHERYARYVLEHADGGLRLVVIDLRGGKPAREGQKLQQRLLRALGPKRVANASAGELPSAIAAHSIVFTNGQAAHGRLPQRHMAEVLSGLGLPPRISRPSP